MSGTIKAQKCGVKLKREITTFIKHLICVVRSFFFHLYLKVEITILHFSHKERKHHRDSKELAQELRDMQNGSRTDLNSSSFPHFQTHASINCTPKHLYLPWIRPSSWILCGKWYWDLGNKPEVQRGPQDFETKVLSCQLSSLTNYLSESLGLSIIMLCLSPVSFLSFPAPWPLSNGN